MNFQIRDAITTNMTNNSAEDVRNVVEDAIKRGEEHLLPGLGVFFEELWKRSGEQEKEKNRERISTSIYSELNIEQMCS